MRHSSLAVLVHTETFVLWTLGELIAISVAAFFVLIRKESRRMARTEHGLCQNCGYDLRAVQECCPECGCPAALAKAKAAPVLDMIRLSDDWPLTPIAPSPIEPGQIPVAVYVTRDGNEAELLAQQFEARGVACRVETKTAYEQIGGFRHRFTHSIFGVAAEDEVAATAIIDRFRVRAEQPAEATTNELAD